MTLYSPRRPLAAVLHRRAGRLRDTGAGALPWWARGVGGVGVGYVWGW
jgi:hypothetical protein